MGTLCEAELRMFWCVAQEIRAAARTGRPSPDDLLELDAMAQHTEWPLLAKRCRAVVRRYAFTEEQETVVG